MDFATDIIFGQIERISIIFPSIGLRCPRSNFSTPLKRFTVSNVKKRVFKSTSATAICRKCDALPLPPDAKTQKMTRFQNQKTQKCLLWCRRYFPHWQTRLTIRLVDNLQCFTKYISKI